MAIALIVSLALFAPPDPVPVGISFLTFEFGLQGELEAFADRRATRFMLQRILDRAAKASLDPFGDGRLRVR
jgi:hypothetical protein